MSNPFAEARERGHGIDQPQFRCLACKRWLPIEAQATDWPGVCRGCQGDKAAREQQEREQDVTEARELRQVLEAALELLTQEKPSLEGARMILDNPIMLGF